MFFSRLFDPDLVAKFVDWGGAVLLQADGLPFHFAPCVPAQWEANFLDPNSAEANVTAPLAVAENSNLEGPGHNSKAARKDKCM